MLWVIVDLRVLIGGVVTSWDERKSRGWLAVLVYVGGHGRKD